MFDLPNVLQSGLECVEKCPYEIEIRLGCADFTLKNSGLWLGGYDLFEFMSWLYLSCVSLTL